MKGRRFSKTVRRMSLAVTAILLCLLGYLFVIPNQEIYEGRKDGTYEKITTYSFREWADSDAPQGVIQEYRFQADKMIENSNAFLIFYTTHQYVQVSTDEELLYSLMPSKENKIGKTIGGNWVSIPLYAKDIGKELIVKLIPVYKSHKGYVPEFFAGSKWAIYMAQFQRELWPMLISIVVTITGFLFLGIALSRIIRKRKGESLAELGLFAALVGLWKICDMPVTAIFFPGRPVFLYYFSLVILMQFTIPMIHFMGRYQKERRIIDGFCLLAIGAAFIQIILQVLGLRDFRESLLITHIMIVLCLICGFVSIFWGWERHQKHNKEWKISNQILPVICLAGIMMDVINYYISETAYSLVFSLLSIFLYIALVGIMTLQGYLSQEKQLLRQDAQLVEAKTSVMLSQIQPHFLYNTLNSIAELCYEDANKARIATIDFAEYLRVNLKGIQEKRLVWFKEELAHVQRYLALEKMRFEEMLNIVYDIQTTMFQLPQLSIQPLVENAVKYGVVAKEEGGTIVLRTWENDDNWYVSVEDDGVGFDINELHTDGKVHIGIENSRLRMEQLCNGTLQITSEKGKGTKVLVCIPKTKEMVK